MMYLRDSSETADYPATSVVVWPHLYRYPVARKYLDVMETHLAGEVREYRRTVLQNDAEGGARKGFFHAPVNLSLVTHKLREDIMANGIESTVT